MATTEDNRQPTETADPAPVCPRCGRTFAGQRVGARCADDQAVLVPAAVAARYGDDPMVGSLVGGKYAVVGVLGMGGFGAVYEAIQEPVGRPVALKVIKPAKEGAQDVRGRFFREARVVAQLNDPAIVTLYDYGEEAHGALYMVFEKVRGTTLSRVMKQGAMAPDRVVRLLAQALRALAQAHRLGLVHRDLKPANLMVTPDALGGESLKVLDFGIAKVLEEAEGHGDTVETREGVVMGTPQYMAPEQARNKPLDGRTDLYALGVVAYALLTGREPFEGDSAVDVLLAHCTVPPPPFDAGSPVPPRLQTVVFKALEKRPEDRFANAEAMITAIRDAMPTALGGHTTSVETLPVDSGDDSVALGTIETLDAPALTTGREFAGEAIAGPPPARGRWAVAAGVVLLAIGGLLFLRPDGAGVTAGAGAADQHVGAASARVADAAPVVDAAQPTDAAPLPDAAPVVDAALVPDAAPPADASVEPPRPKPTARPAPPRPSPPVERPAPPAETPKVPAEKPPTLTVPEF